MSIESRIQRLELALWAPGYHLALYHVKAKIYCCMWQGTTILVIAPPVDISGLKTSTQMRLAVTTPLKQYSCSYCKVVQLHMRP